MEGDFLVSIITPVYNGDKYLKTYFEQIEALTFKNIEIIIVNDGSTDKSSEIIIEYAKNDKRIRYINKLENAGVSQARNDAIDVASGKWLFFFDCDDTFDKNIISNCIDTVDNENDTVCYNYASVRKNGEIAVHEFSYDCSVYSKLDKYDLISHSLGTTISEMKDYIAGKRTMRAGKELNGPWRIMYSLEIIKKNNLQFNEGLRIGEDTIFTNEYLAKCDNVKTLNKILYYLHNNSGSAIDAYNSNVDRMINGKIQLIKEKIKLTERINEECIYDVYNLWGGIHPFFYTDWADTC